MITIPNTIKNINPDYRVLTTQSFENSSEIFENRRFKIEILLSLNKSNRLLREAKFIEVYLMSNNIPDFNSQFENSLLTETNNNKKYTENENFKNIFKNDIRKNIFSEYNSSYNINRYNYLNKVFEFDQENFISDHNETYELVLDQDFSKQIFNRSSFSVLSSLDLYFNNIRISILDEKYNVIDISRFYNIDFSNDTLSREVETIDIREFYKPQITEFVESLSIEANIPNEIQISNDTLSNVLGLDDLKYQIYLSYSNVQIQSTYFTAEASIVVNANNVTGGLTLLQSFLRKISIDYYAGQQEFVLLLAFAVKQEESFSPIHTAQRILSFNREDTFITNLSNRQELPIMTNIFNTITTESDIQYQESKFGIPLNLSSSIETDNQIWQLITVENIFINSQELDFFYNNFSFNIESKVDYKGMTYKELFIDNNFTLWQNLSQYLSSGGVVVSIILFYDSLPLRRRINFPEINLNLSYFEENVSFIPNTLNQLFKENLSCTGINPNFSLNESNRSIFLYDSFVLNNVEYFNDISLSYGYDNIPDFLRNCKIKINKIANVNGVRRNDYSFANFNDMFSVDSNNFLITNISFLNSFRFLDLIYNDFGEDSIYNNESNIYRFLITTNKNEKQIILQEIENIDIGNNLEFEILPIPKIINDNIGCGFNSNNNINIRDNTGSVSKFENTLLLYLGNIIQVRKNLLKNLMFSEGNEITENLIEQLLYNFKTYNGLSQNNFYTNNILYNKNQILDLINTQEEVEIDALQADIMRSGIINRSRPIFNNYYNFSIDENFISYLNMPVFINFNNKIVSYDEKEDCYLPKAIEFLYDFGQEVILNTDHINSVFNKFPNSLRFSEIRSEQFGIKNADVRFSFHMILSKKENYDRVEAREQNIRRLLQTNSLLDSTILLDSNLNSELFLPSNILTSEYNGKECIYNIGSVKSSSEFRGYLRSKELDLTIFSNLLAFAKDNNFTYLEDIIIRTHLKFDIENNTIDTVFTSKIPFLNYGKNLIKIDNVRAIATSLR